MSAASDSGDWNCASIVDGVRPTQRLSGDYFRISGRTTTYFGSWIVDVATVSRTATQVMITGIARTTWPTTFNRVRVIIPRSLVIEPAAPATVQWSNAAGQRGATYICAFNSRYFRTVDLEQDCESAVAPFVSYNTGSLPSGGPARTLTVVGAYREAGIEMRSAGTPNQVPAAPGGTWSNAELHNAMVTHFSLWRDDPQWKVWLLHARLHEYGSGLLGIMFDQAGRQRQGCAVFYQGLGGNAAEAQRNQLFTCVHELGHCFNLYHSFHKQYMNPPLPNRPLALSWMNYPWGYPSGETEFWESFPFEFDNLETIHLRHGFRDNVIMGANPFGTGAALTRDFEAPVEDTTGLRLELRSRPLYRLGEPVVVEIKLGLDGARSGEVEPHLHPAMGNVRLAIRKPGGLVVLHEPPIHECMQPATKRLTTAKPAVYESAYIGYGKEGITFDAPGTYQLRAICPAPDGSILVSNTLEVRVRPPRNEADEEVADLLMGDEQGMLFSLLGSDSEHLASGNASFQEAIEKYPAHPLTLYARLAIGFNAARQFVNLKADGTITVRKPDVKEAEAQLTAVIEGSLAEDQGLDNISLGEAFVRLAKTQKETGKDQDAKATVDQMLSVFEEKQLRRDVLATIRARGAAALK